MLANMQIKKVLFDTGKGIVLFDKMDRCTDQIN